MNRYDDFRSRTPIQIPDLPPYFPNELGPLATVIMEETRREFPLQSRALDFLKMVVFRLGPKLCAKVRPDLAQFQMEQLVEVFLRVNFHGSSRHGQFKDALTQSNEWLDLARACTPNSDHQEQEGHSRIGPLRKLVREFLHDYPAGTPSKFLDWAEFEKKPVPDGWVTGKGKWSSVWRDPGLRRRLEQAFSREKRHQTITDLPVSVA